MNFRYTLKTAITGLKTNKMRSMLTILGIVIGITSIILVMSLGKSAKELILSQIRGMGSAIIDIDPGREPQGISDFAEIFTDSLRQKDVEALKKIPGVAEVSPNVILNSNISFENESKRVMIMGCSNLIFKIFELYPQEGEFFTQEHIRQRATVVVLGAKVKEHLFGNSEAVGKKVKIKNQTFRVIGVMKTKGRASMFDVDNMATIPYLTAQNYLLGINYYHNIILQAESEEVVPRVAYDAEITLRESHNITDPSKDDFNINTQADAMERVNSVMSILTVLLSAVAAISLIVGGIGIMNIMLVSVTERTREIGLRKALGATEKNILLQFLFEAVILTVAGGLTGIALATFFSLTSFLILSRVLSIGWVFTFSLPAVVLGLGISSFIGLLFGLYPAKKAARKNPIDALRYE